MAAAFGIMVAIMGGMENQDLVKLMVATKSRTRSIELVVGTTINYGRV